MGATNSAILSYFLALGRAWSSDRPLKNKNIRKIILRQILFTGAQALRIVVVAAVVLSIVLIAQSSAQLQRLGGANSIGSIVSGFLIREAAAFVTLIVVVARSVSAVASELSTMKANGEIDSLRAAGVSVLSYLVIPRVVGGTLSTVLLAMHFAWISVLVGFAASSVLIDLSWSIYWDSLLSSLTVVDLSLFFFKAIVLSFVIFTMATFYGLRTTGAAFEVPQATTKAVVWSLMFCLIAQTIISVLYFWHLMMSRGLGGVL